MVKKVFVLAPADRWRPASGRISADLWSKLHCFNPGFQAHDGCEKLGLRRFDDPQRKY